MELLNKEAALEYLWGNHRTSIKEILANLANKFPGLKKLIVTIKDVDDARRQLLRIRDLLRKKHPEKWIGGGIADILHLTAYAQIFFRDVPYSSFKSQEIKLRKGEIPRNSKLKTTPLIKTYSPLHIQGIMAGWFKQSVEKPHASLSADKRGAITLSSLEHLKDMDYNKDIRSKLINHIKSKPASPWPAKSDLRYPWGTFINSSRVMGTPMFDTFHHDADAIDNCLRYIDVPADACVLPPYIGLH